MISELMINKKLSKKNDLMQKIEKATGYKKTQLEGKLKEFNAKNYPDIVWEGSKGTYKKPVEEMEL
mgnify:CR=1 FL=1